LALVLLPLAIEAGAAWSAAMEVFSFDLRGSGFAVFLVQSACVIRDFDLTTEHVPAEADGCLLGWRAAGSRRAMPRIGFCGTRSGDRSNSSLPELLLLSQQVA
jgi:hypothetical protein